MSRQPDGAVLLTGATGFVGMELLARYLERGDRPDRRAGPRRRRRAPPGDRARRRARQPVRPRRRAIATPAASQAVAGELTAPGLGLAGAAPRATRREVTTIVHSAASVSFSLPLEEARDDQPRGHPADARVRRRWLASAVGWIATATSRPPMSRGPTTAASPSAISTSARASATPTSSRSSRPSSWSAHSRACRSRSCAPASSSATAAAAGRPPSTSSTGRCGRSRAGCSRRSRRSPRAPVDVVSIDYVADAIHELCERPRRRRRDLPPDRRQATRARCGRSPSWPAATSAGRCPRSCPAGRVRRARLQRHSSARRSRARACTSRTSRSATVFDESATRARLEPAGIRVSPLGDYLERLLDFATRSRWGKKPDRRASEARSMALQGEEADRC